MELAGKQLQGTVTRVTCIETPSGAEHGPWRGFNFDPASHIAYAFILMSPYDIGDINGGGPEPGVGFFILLGLLL